MTGILELYTVSMHASVPLTLPVIVPGIVPVCLPQQVVVVGSSDGVAHAVAHRLGQDSSGCSVRAVFEGKSSPGALDLPDSVDVRDGAVFRGNEDNCVAALGSAAKGATTIIVAPVETDVEGEVLAGSFYRALADTAANERGLKNVRALAHTPSQLLLSGPTC